ncbi:MAG: DUF4352 domain-containing protein [Candidatus Thermoplasmatota archaeon]
MRSKIQAMVIFLVLVIGLSAALTGCLDEDEPETELTVLGEEEKDEDLEGSSPESGNKFYWIHVELKNKGVDQDINPAAEYFILETEEGEEYKDPQADDLPDKIEPEKAEDFWLVFEIPENESALRIRYEP